MAYSLASGPGFIVASDRFGFQDGQRIRCGPFSGKIQHVSAILGMHSVPTSCMLFFEPRLESRPSGEPSGEILIEP